MTPFRALLVCVGLAFLIKPLAFAFPNIVNGSFEDDGDAPVWPGLYLNPNGWRGVGFAGINPVLPQYEEALVFYQQNIRALNENVPNVNSTGIRTPFANNGMVPHSNHVFYLQSVNSTGIAESSVTQGVSGFESGKTYVLRYFCNARSGYAGATNIVTLNGVVIDSFVPTAVNGANVHTAPYHRRFSSEVSLPGTGPYDLTFAIHPGGNWRGEPFPRDASPLPSDTFYARDDRAILLDHVQFIELGPMKLSGARRSFVDKTKVLATFDMDLSEESKTNSLNFIINGLRVSAAEPGPDSRSVLLTHAQELEDGFPASLRVTGVLDRTGKGMFAVHSTTVISLDPIDPAEMGIDLKGFMDDFNSSRRNPKWIPLGLGGDVYRQETGYLIVSTASGGPNHLVYRDNYNDKEQEVLARIRPRFLEGSQGRGGIAVSVDSESSGINYVLRQTGGNGAAMEVDAPASLQTQVFPWQPNEWYWIRLSRTLENNNALVRGKIWKADRDTPEPGTWTLLQNPASLPSGLAGITAGSNSDPAEFDIDWILIKADELPVIRVLPPKPRPAGLNITPTEEGIEVSWLVENSGYNLESSANLEPDSWIMVTDFFQSQDGTKYLHVVSAEEGNLFFRLVNYFAQE